jgi:hypothetical protein
MMPVSDHEFETLNAVPPLVLGSVTNSRTFADAGRADRPVTTNFRYVRYWPERTRRAASLPKFVVALLWRINESADAVNDRADATKFAVYVVAVEGATIVRDWVPASDHDENTYDTPPSVCGEVAVTELAEPTITVRVKGVVELL